MDNRTFARGAYYGSLHHVYGDEAHPNNSHSDDEVVPRKGKEVAMNWPAVRGKEMTLCFPEYDANGDLVPGIQDFDAKVSVDHGPLNATVNDPYEVSPGVYTITLTPEEMDGEFISTVLTSSDTVPTVNVISTAHLGESQLAIQGLNGASHKVPKDVSPMFMPEVGQVICAYCETGYWKKDGRCFACGAPLGPTLEAMRKRRMF